MILTVKVRINRSTVVESMKHVIYFVVDGLDAEIRECG